MMRSLFQRPGMFFGVAVLLWVGGSLPTPAWAQSTATEIQASAIAPFDGDFAKIQIDGKTKYLHRSGRVVVDKPEQYGSPICLAIKDDAYGAINSLGDVIAEFKYDGVRYDYDEIRSADEEKHFHYFIAIVQLAGRYGAFDTLGTQLAEPLYEDILPINGQVLAARKDGKWGLLSMQDGREVLPFIYDKLEKSYVLDQAVNVVQGNQTGIRSPDGERELVPPVYTSIRGLRLDAKQLIEAKRDDGLFLLDSSGRVLREVPYDHMRADRSMVRVEKAGKIGWLAADGEEVVPLQYDEADSWRYGRCIVRQGNTQGVLASDGSTVLPCRYSKVSLIDQRGQQAYEGPVIAAPSFGNTSSEAKPTGESTNEVAYILVEEAGKKGVFDRNGKPLVPIVYDDVRVTSIGGQPYLQVVVGDRFGVMDHMGKELLPVGYRLPPYGYGIHTPTDAPAHVIGFSDGERVGLYDTQEQRVLLPPEYSQIEWQLGYFILATASKSTDDYSEPRVSAYFNVGGKQLIPPTEYLFVDAVDTDRYVLRTLRDGSWESTLFDAEGTELYRNSRWDFKTRSFNQLLLPDSVSQSRQLSYFQNGLLKVRAQENLFVDRQGREKRFDGLSYVGDFYGGLAVAARKVDGQAYMGIIDTAGNEVLPLIYSDIDKLYSSDLLKTSKDGKTGLIDVHGRVILEPQYTSIQVHKRVERIAVGDGRYNGVVDRQGAVVLPSKYTAIRLHGDRFFEIQIDEKIGFAATDGTVLISPRYEEINLNRDYYGYFPALVQVDGKWTYIRADGSVLPITANEKIGFR